jgi:hypothetical protein
LARGQKSAKNILVKNYWLGNHTGRSEIID